MKNNSAFTLKGSGCLNALITDCIIFPAFNPEDKGSNPQGKSYKGLWDTGASNTVITKKIADELGLKPTGMVEVRHAGGTDMVPTYAINIGLPNGVAFCFIKVSEGNLSDFDVLIGMDIITKGDFSITNVDRSTSLSFRIPSLETVDYVLQNDIEKQKDNKVTEVTKDCRVGRNDLCPCGSGKKYKRCHGK